MQLLELLSALSRSELAKLDQHISFSGRKDMKTLYGELKKIRNKPHLYQREKVFKKVFRQSFKNKSAYLLKNEIRHLKNAIYQFLADIELTAEISSNQDFLNRWVLKALEKRGVNRLFSLEVEKMIKRAARNYNTELATAMMTLKNNFFTRPSLASPLDHKEHLGFLKAWTRMEIQRTVHTIRDIESNEAYLLRAMAIKKDNSASFEKTIAFKPLENIKLADYENDLTAFTNCFTESYLRRGKDRIKSLQKALKLLQNASPKFPESDEDEVTLLFNIASALMAEHRYAEAGKYLQESMETAKKYKVPVPVSGYYMTLKNFQYLKQYSRAIDYFHDNEKAILDNPYMDQSLVALAYCYLSLNKSSEAVKVINFDDKTPEGESRQLLNRYYVNIIGFIIDDEPEHAHRELVNFKKFISRKKNPTILEQENWHLLDRYTQIKMGSEKNKKQALISLQSEIQKCDPSFEVISGAFLWIKRRVETEISSLLE